MMEEISLKVGELTNREEFGRGIVRIDTRKMQDLGIKEGEIVELQGQKKTGVIAVRSYPADVGLNLIRMDGITRRNAGIGVGENIKVVKANAKEARRIVLAPAQKGIILQMSPDLLKKNLIMRPLMKKDLVAPFPVATRRRGGPFDDFFGGMNIEEIFFAPIPGETKLVVVSTNPEGMVHVTEETEVELKPEAVDIEEKAIPTITYEDIGGLGESINKIREMVELPMRHPELFTKLGIEPPKGVLLYGPPGTGKTLLARAVANESGVNFFSIGGPEIISKWYGESEANLRRIFEEAEKNAPAIIFIDEIDAIAPKREEVTGEVERRVVSQILTLMDGLKSRGKVIVIAATNRQNALDPALRRPGRFDREVEIGVPDQKGRKEILQIHTRNMPLDNSPAAIDPDIEFKILDEELKNIVNKIKIGDVTKFLKEKGFEYRKISERDNTRIGELIYEYIKEDIEIESDTKAYLIIDKCVAKIAESMTNLIIENKNNESELKNSIESKIKEIKKDNKQLIFISVKEMIIDDLASKTYGFVGADLEALAKEAAMSALRRNLPQISWRTMEEFPPETIEKLKVTKLDFDNALKLVEPSAMREVLVEIPKVKWDDVGGLNEVKESLREIVEWPLKHPESFERIGIRPPKGVLLYGPPGSGKTLLARAVATESGANFISIKGPEITSKWVGESERHIRDIFRRARQVAPSIIFFDEIDSLAPIRGLEVGSRVSENIVSQILTEMSGLEDMHNVVVIAASNRPDIIDPALMRPGRFDRQVLVPAPDEDARLEILKIHTKKMPLKGVDLKPISKETDGYSGADLEALVREAGLNSLRKDFKAKTVGKKEFEEAVKRVTPSITPELVKFYSKISERIRAPPSEKSKEKLDYVG